MLCRSLLAGGTLGALVLVSVFATAQNKETKESKSPLEIKGKTLLATEDLKWVALPGIDGAQYATLVCDVFREPHRAFFKYPVGLKSPLHTHTHGDRGVIVSGMLSLAVDGAAPKKLPPGSFFSIGAGVRHVTAVEGDQPCVFYMEREGPFDVVVASEAGSKKQ